MPEGRRRERGRAVSSGCIRPPHPASRSLSSGGAKSQVG